MLTRTKTKLVLVGIIGGLGLGLGGCVSQQHYDQLEMQYRAAADRNAALARENEQYLAALELQKGASDGATSTLDQLRAENERLRNQLEQTNALLAEIDGQMRELDFMDPATDRALRELAQRFPNVVVYDSHRGMLRFASDLTFNSGSDQLRQGAKDTLKALGEVLKSNAGGQYEIQIIGYTDSQPISSGTAQRHPTNTHLSVHRAISVKQLLTSLGIPADRILVAGWGESHPAVPNTPSGNTPQNRRVEIFFRPDSSGSTSISSEADTQMAPARPVDPTK